MTIKPKGNTVFKWYVFDEADCFDSTESVQEAAIMAADLVDKGMKGVHIAYMLHTEFAEYCRTGKFPYSK